MPPKKDKTAALFTEVFGFEPTREMMEEMCEVMTQRTELMVRFGLLHKAAHASGFAVPLPTLCTMMEEMMPMLLDERDSEYIANQIDARFAEATKNIDQVKPEIVAAMEQHFLRAIDQATESIPKPFTLSAPSASKLKH